MKSIDLESPALEEFRMIKFIKVDEALPLRNIVLREGRLKPDECRFPSDNIPGNFHLGYYDNKTLICIASFHPQNLDGFEGRGYQLRGMATADGYKGQGIGSQLVQFSFLHLRKTGVGYVWCNARKIAVKFYANLGFEVISPEFEVPGIGPHYVMHADLQSLFNTQISS